LRRAAHWGANLRATDESNKERLVQIADRSLWVSLSMGVTELLANESIEQWQQRTKGALNQSKAVGGDCGHVIQGRDLTRITRHAESREKGEESSSQSLGYEQPMAAETDKLEKIDGIESRPTNRAKASHAFASRLDDDAYLFNLETLASEFESLRGRLDAKTPIFASAIRFTDPPKGSQRRLLLRILRAEMRCIDRLGNQGGSIFLLSMPSADA
jgi:hypothetical protein